MLGMSDKDGIIANKIAKSMFEHFKKCAAEEGLDAGLSGDTKFEICIASSSLLLLSIYNVFSGKDKEKFNRLVASTPNFLQVVLNNKDVNSDSFPDFIDTNMHH